MTWESWAWVGWALVFAVVEVVALVQKDRPGRPRTLSANLRWLVTGAGPWHYFTRGLFVGFLAWLGPHVLGR